MSLARVSERVADDRPRGFARTRWRKRDEVAVARIGDEYRGLGLHCGSQTRWRAIWNPDPSERMNADMAPPQRDPSTLLRETMRTARPSTYGLGKIAIRRERVLEEFNSQLRDRASAFRPDRQA